MVKRDSGWISVISSEADLSSAILRDCTYKVHVRNAQKEELERLRRDAEQFWHLSDLLRGRPCSFDANWPVAEPKENALGDYVFKLSDFLTRYKVKKPTT